MQAIIMAAGKGSRLGELTKGLPKSFIEINGKKLIEYNIDVLHELGINDIIIVTGYRYNSMEEKFKNDKTITLINNPFYEKGNVLSSFWVGQSLLKDDFLYLHADTICEKSIFDDLVSSQAEVALPIDFKPCDEEAMKVRLANGYPQEINKTMDCSISDGEFIGIAKIRKTALSSLKNHTIQALKEGMLNSYFEESLQRLLDEKKYRFECIATNKRFWAEIDFVEDYERAKSAMLANK